MPARSNRGVHRLALLLLALTLPATVAAKPVQAASSTLGLGVAGGAILDLPDRATWLERLRGESATTLRIDARWSTISPTAPPPAQATDPAWEGYRWTNLDDQVRALSGAGIAPILLVNGAPIWAQAPGRPAAVADGAWKPDPAAYGRFAQALATRYSGHYPDPTTPGASLPRVSAFQLWNEPNLDSYLAPQRESGKPFAPVRFRELVDAGYRGIKAAQPAATVIAGGLAPFGDYAGELRRTPPVRFLRSMLCLNDELRRACRDRTTVDVLAHHPYAVRKPSSPARNPDDVTIPDLGKLTKVVRAARRAGTLGPRTPRLWVTEVSYDSSPPDPRGVPSARLGRWTSELLWRLSRQGVSTVLWYQLRDQAPVPDYASTFQSGLYLLDGTRKPSAQAFRFPLVVSARTATRLSVWFRVPEAGRVRVEVRRRGRWSTVARRTVPAAGVRTLSVTGSRVDAVRAVLPSGESSYVWSVR